MEVINKALCISKDELLERVLHAPSVDGVYKAFGKKFDDVFTLRNALVPLTECEVSDTLIQLMPFVILTKTVLEDGVRVKKYLSYVKEATGINGRTKDLRSIGWTGHVDKTYPFLNSKFAVVSALQRELYEDTGLRLSTPQFNKAVNKTGVLYYVVSDDVSKRHLCISFEHEVNIDFVAETKEGVVQDAMWISETPSVDYELETWSKLALALAI